MIPSRNSASDILACMLMMSGGAALLTTTTARSDTAADVASDVDSIVVSAQPIRDSLARSLEVQREADNLVSVIATF